MRTTAINQVLQEMLSTPRLEKYLVARGGDLHQALSLYEWNTRLSEAFYTPLQCMEICLRNKLSDQLSAAYGVDWLVSQTIPLENDAREQIESAMRDIETRGKTLTSGAVVAELSFGFWVALLGPRYDATLWRKALYLVFLENGKRIRRDRVHGRLNALRRFRNRIAHHEPIFLSNLPNTHREIIETTNWMCSVTAAWSVHQSRFQVIFDAG